jgi:diacylglycerol O-acyltransferase
VTDVRFEDRMSDADALMWSIEKDPLLRSTVIGVSVFDAPLDRTRLVEAIDRLSRIVPRFRQRVHASPWSIAPPRWEVDPNFDLSFHLRFLRAPGQGSLRDLLDLAAPIAMHGFDRARPLWELHVVEGLEDNKSATVMKLHHAISDGVGLVQIFMNLFDLDRQGTDRGPMPAVPDPTRLSEFAGALNAIGHEQRRALGVARRLGSNVAQTTRSILSRPVETAVTTGAVAASVGRMLAPAFDPLSDVMKDRSLSVRFDAMRLPLNELKRAAKAADGKLNDAFVAGVIGGLRRYHVAHGSDVSGLRMGMPINIRDAATEGVGGNQFIPTRFVVPLDIDDPIERMRTINGLVAQQRAEPAMGLFLPMSGVLRRLPTATTTALFGSLLKGVDFTTSNVPGLPMSVYEAGARLEMNMPFGPLAGSAANITLVSYIDDVDLGISTNPAAIQDPEALMENLHESFDEILKISA